MSFGKRTAPPLPGQSWTPEPAFAAVPAAAASGSGPSWTPEPAYAAGPAAAPASYGDMPPEQYTMATAADWTPGASTRRRGDAGLPGPDRRLVLKIAGAALLIPLWCVFSVWMENQRSIPRDLNPGTMVTAETYVAPAGCPVRAWSVGEYLPRACLHGMVVDAYGSGLQPTAYERHELRRQRWIRTGPDALAVACPMQGDCLVQNVVRDRFTGERPADDPAAASHDFRTPSLAYWLSYPINWPVWGVVAVLTFIGYVLRRTFRRR